MSLPTITDRQFRQHCWEVARTRLLDVFSEFCGGGDLPLQYSQADVECMANAISGPIDRLIWYGAVGKVTLDAPTQPCQEAAFQTFLERALKVAE